jgi:hypothetical protein
VSSSSLLDTPGRGHTPEGTLVFGDSTRHNLPFHNFSLAQARGSSCPWVSCWPFLSWLCLIQVQDDAVLWGGRGKQP